MPKRGVLAGAAGLIAVALAGAVAVVLSGTEATPAAQAPAVTTAPVERGALSDLVSQYGTLTYRARPDGSPYRVINQARGTYTRLPAAGDTVACGDVLLRVDDRPVLLLCGSTPAYRPLAEGDEGRDVRALNANLVYLGYATRMRLDPASDEFGSTTTAALAQLQSALGEAPTGKLGLGAAVFLPRPVRIAALAAELGGPARPGARALDATSSVLEVQVALDPSQQDEVQPGDRVRITLPGNESVTGKVDRLGRVAQVPSGQDGNGGGATIPAYVRLDDPEKARGLDRAPVQVEIATKGVSGVLSVPVTAIVGKAGGGFAVELVRPGGRRELVAVTPGLFDTAGGRVEVAGALRAGDRVVVPSP